MPWPNEMSCYSNGVFMNTYFATVINEDSIDKILALKRFLNME
jgi:hypothetical protein